MKKRFFAKEILLIVLMFFTGGFVQAQDNETPLMKAARKGNAEEVKFLISQDADVNAKDKYGRNVLMWAVWQGWEGPHEVLKVLTLLLEKGAQVNTKDNYGETVLMWAAYSGHLEVVKFLLEKGAEAKVKDVNGNTARTMAAAAGYNEIVKLLDSVSGN